jgi:hypothetical protein
MSHPWFRPRTFGYGWTPITWEGWVATFVFVAVVVATTALGDPRGASGPQSVHLLLGAKALLGLSGTRFGIAPMLSIIAAEVGVFLVFAHWKSSGR